MALVRGGPHVPVEIYFGLPRIDGEEIDRSPRWCCVIDGKTTRLRDGVTELLDIEKAWPWCARRPIPKSEYEYLVARGNHAREWLPHSPAANPRKPMDWNKAKTIF